MTWITITYKMEVKENYQHHTYDEVNRHTDTNDFINIEDETELIVDE